ncbi:MAG TPA: hypothetical protein DEB39_05995 [Planctomycetaceae bacterium]|nr:hypothetical protein [Planctomycetaceae bacterium]
MKHVVLPVLFLAVVPPYAQPSFAQPSHVQPLLFEAVDTEERSTVGTLESLSAAGATLRNANGEHEFARERLVRLRNVTPMENPTGDPGQTASRLPRGFQLPDASEPVRRPDELLPPLLALVGLVDGSRVSAVRYNADSKNATLERPGESEKWTVPTGSVTDVRFNVPADDLREMMAANADTATSFSLRNEESRIRLLRTNASADRLVIARADALDTHAGIILSIDDKTVLFETDGEKLPIPREKISAVIYFHGIQTPRAPEIAVLHDRTGSRLALTDVTLGDDGTLAWTALSGEIAAKTPLSLVTEIVFPQRNLVPLARLKPSSVERTAFYSWNEPQNASNGPLESFTKWTAPRWNEENAGQNSGLNVGLNVGANEPGIAKKTDALRESAAATVLGGKVQLDGNTYADALALRAKTVLAYDFPEPFERMRGLAGIDDRLRPAGHGRLQILGDQTVLFDAVLRGDRETVPINLSLKGVRRLTITVDFPDGVDNACQIVLAAMKLFR